MKGIICAGIGLVVCIGGLIGAAYMDRKMKTINGKIKDQEKEIEQMLEDQEKELNELEKALKERKEEQKKAIQEMINLEKELKKIKGSLHDDGCFDDDTLRYYLDSDGEWSIE